MTGTDPDGNDVSMTGLTSDVVRRQPDGNWLFVIDNPIGGEGIAVNTGAL
jgi:ketosteroid isomerase-like protein